MEMEDVYPTIGSEGFTALIRNFYAQIPDDPILGPMYPEQDWEGAEKRLRDFLIYRFGGPPTYIEERGHPRLRMRHMPFAIDQAARDRWVELMAKALEQTDTIPQDVRRRLNEFLADVATFLINRAPA
jgi:hemoglobin